jgi:hypothetical protein
MNIFVCCANVFSSLCAFAIAQNVFHLTPLRCDDPSLNRDCCSCESIDRDCGSRWPAQTLRTGLLWLRCRGNDAPASRLWGVQASSGSSANGPALLLAGSRKDGLALASARTEWEPHLVPARARVGAGAFPFPSLRTFRATIGADLLASSSSRCFTSVRFLILLLVCRSCRSASCSKQPARYWSWPASEGQFPFPTAPEFWGSWTIS